MDKFNGKYIHPRCVCSKCGSSHRQKSSANADRVKRNKNIIKFYQQGNGLGVTAGCFNMTKNNVRVILRNAGITIRNYKSHAGTL